jgi:hypothetical protein
MSLWPFLDSRDCDACARNPPLRQLFHSATGFDRFYIGNLVVGWNLDAIQDFLQTNGRFASGFKTLVFREFAFVEAI